MIKDILEVKEKRVKGILERGRLGGEWIYRREG